MADAHDSGSCGGNPLEVQVLFQALRADGGMVDTQP